MAKKDIDGLIGGMGVATSLISSLLEEVKRIGGTAEDVHRLVKPEGRQTITEMAKLVVFSSIDGNIKIKLDVNYDQSLIEAVKEGKYDDCFTYDLSLKNFPNHQSGQKEVELVLFCFGRQVYSKEVYEFEGKHGFRIATPRELLKLGARLPKLQLRFPMVALGPVGRHSLLLYGCNNRRGLSTTSDSPGVLWNGNYRFAFVREKKQ
ncbi:MAG: hypothetical protein WC297_00610 [Candidatus Paceibacterota bacterium]|jgi:hypothetical protein